MGEALPQEALPQPRGLLLQPVSACSFLWSPGGVPLSNLIRQIPPSFPVSTLCPLVIQVWHPVLCRKTRVFLESYLPTSGRCRRRLRIITNGSSCWSSMTGGPVVSVVMPWSHCVGALTTTLCGCASLATTCPNQSRRQSGGIDRENSKVLRVEAQYFV
jgi:hypothetical protein